MKEQKSYVAIDTTATYEEADYMEYKHEKEECGAHVVSMEEWMRDTREWEIDDFMDSLKYGCDKYGRVTINGSIGAWDGRHEICPLGCASLYHAVWKCIDGQNDFKVTVYMDEIVVETWNHDSMYHGGNVFHLTLENDREELWIF